MAGLSLASNWSQGIASKGWRGILCAGLLGTVLCGKAGPALYAQESASQPGPDSRLPGLSGKPNPAPNADLQDTMISPDDLLEVYVLDVPEFSREYRVSPTGSIALPLLPDPINAAGLTPSQLSTVIVERLRAGGFVSSPQVTVRVMDSRVHSVAITGAVKKPQIYPLFGRTTLLDVLSQAEGLTEDAGTTAVITRGEITLRRLREERVCQGSEQKDVCSPTLRVDLKKLMDSGDPNLNVDLYPGDRVTVQRGGVIYVVGAVNRPGGFPLKGDEEEITVLKALALAQDTKSSAAKTRAMIIRRSSERSTQREEIRVNLKSILAGRAPDVPMARNDILFVPDSAGKKAAMRGAESALQATIGIIIWSRP